VVYWAAKAHAEAPAHSAFLCREPWTGADAQRATEDAYVGFAEKLLELLRAA